MTLAGVAATLVAWASGHVVRGETRAENSAGKYALLVGVTRYDNLSRDRDLEGPANDVTLLKKTLVERFGFDAANITTLADAEGPMRRPTRANIQAEFARLAKVVKAGDQVVVLLSGHGSQQPDQPPLDENDGLDEIFLPADVKEWDDAMKTVPNAIIDDELGVWSKAIVARGAALFVIVDSCHSGSALRGNEVYREIPAGELIPAAVLKQVAGQRGGKANGLDLEETERIVALYAAQSHEKAPEMAPYDGSSKDRYGLLTYTLCKLLTRAQAPLSYRDVAQRIHAEYVHFGRVEPTPLIEGSTKGLNAKVLGAEQVSTGRSITLQVSPDGTLRVNAGALHGLTKNSVLAVFLPAGAAASKKPLGHVIITQCLMAEAAVKPLAHAGLPETRELPPGAVCRVAAIDYGIGRLKVALSPSAKALLGTAAKDIMKSGSESFFTVIDSDKEAEWVVDVANGALQLVTAKAFASRGVKLPDSLTVVKLDMRKPATSVQRALEKIARARYLLALATADKAGETGIRFEVEMVKLKNIKDTDGMPLTWGKDGVRLTNGVTVAWRLTNPNRFHSVDVTLLYIDSQFGIHALPCSAKEKGNRMKPRTTWLTPAIEIEATTVGMEHVVVIALKGEGQPVDFSWLTQPTWEEAQELHRGGNASDSPLGKLFQSYLYAKGETRGGDVEMFDNYYLGLNSFFVE